MKGGEKEAFTGRLKKSGNERRGRKRRREVEFRGKARKGRKGRRERQEEGGRGRRENEERKEGEEIEEEVERPWEV